MDQNNNTEVEGGRRRSSSTRLHRRDSIVEFMKAIIEGSDEDKESDSSSRHGNVDESRASKLGDGVDNSQINDAYSTSMAPPLRPPSRASVAASEQSGRTPGQTRQHQRSGSHTTMQNTIYSDISPEDLANYLRRPAGDLRRQGRGQQQHLGSDRTYASFTSRVSGGVGIGVGVGNRTTDQPDFDSPPRRREEVPLSWSTFGLHGDSAYGKPVGDNIYNNTSGGGARRAASLDLAPLRRRDEYNDLQASLAATSAAVQREEDAYFHAADGPAFRQPLGSFGDEEETYYQNQVRHTDVDEAQLPRSLLNLGEEDRNAKRRRLMMSGCRAASERVLGSGPMHEESAVARRSSMTTTAATAAPVTSPREFTFRHSDPHSSTNSQLHPYPQGSITGSFDQGNKWNAVPLYVQPFQQQDQQHQQASASSAASSFPESAGLMGTNPAAMSFTSHISPTSQSPFGSGIMPPNIAELLLQRQQQTLMQACPPLPLAAHIVPNPAALPSSSPIVLRPSDLLQPQQLLHHRYHQPVEDGQMFPGYLTQQQSPPQPSLESLTPPTSPQDDDAQVTETNASKKKKKKKQSKKEKEKKKDDDTSLSFERKPLSAAFDAIPLVPPSIPLSEELGTTMSASEVSQKSIHDWDRSMGLRRSHSKTMRASMRSRKRLQEVRAIQDMFGVKGLVRREERAKTA